MSGQGIFWHWLYLLFTLNLAKVGSDTVPHTNGVRSKKNIPLHSLNSLGHSKRLFFFGRVCASAC